MGLRRNKKLAAVAAAAIAASAIVWAMLPNANAATNVTWFAGHIVIGTGQSVVVQATNYTNSPKTAIFFIRKTDGTLQSPIANTNTVSNIPADNSVGRGYTCASGPCFFTIKVTTTSVLVVPSASYGDSSGAPAAVSTGDFFVRVVKT